MKKKGGLRGKDFMQDMVEELIQETKVEEEYLLLLRRSKWKLNSGKAVSYRGTCGGLATLWCDEKFQLKKKSTQH